MVKKDICQDWPAKPDHRIRILLLYWVISPDQSIPNYTKAVVAISEKFENRLMFHYLFDSFNFGKYPKLHPSLRFPVARI